MTTFKTRRKKPIGGLQKGETVQVARVCLSTKEAMAYLGCKRDALDSLRVQGAVRCSKFGNTLYWWLQDIHDLLERTCTNTRLHEEWTRVARRGAAT